MQMILGLSSSRTSNILAIEIHSILSHAATILLVLTSANSMMNYTYAATKNTPIQNGTNQHAPLPGSTTFLNVVTKVDNTNGGTKQPSDCLWESSITKDIY